jgi:hypothetical protein
VADTDEVDGGGAGDHTFSVRSARAQAVLQLIPQVLFLSLLLFDSSYPLSPSLSAGDFISEESISLSATP